MAIHLTMSGVRISHSCRRRETMDHVELRVVLLEEHGLGRITVGLEEYFDFSFSLSDELEQLENEFGDIPACGWDRVTPNHDSSN